MVANPFDHGYYNEHDLRQMGFAEVGDNVVVDKTCTIIGLKNIRIGSNVRIDGYCSLIAPGQGSLHLGSYIHIGAYCYMGCGDGVVMEDFSGLSQGVRIYSRTDDYTGEFLTNPTVPEEYTGVFGGKVVLGRHVIVGSGSVILPGVTIEEGSSVGALAVVNKSLPAWGVYVGVPAKRLKERSQKLLELESRLLGRS